MLYLELGPEPGPSGALATRSPLPGACPARARAIRLSHAGAPRKTLALYRAPLRPEGQNLTGDRPSF